MDKYIRFLDALADSGRVNMFGAASELREEFPGVSKTESRTILKFWMEKRRAAVK